MLTVSTFVVLLDASVVNVALPVIVRDLGGSLDATAWVLAGFVLAFAVLLLPSSKLADLLVLASIVVSPLAGAVSARTDVQWLVVPGFALVAIGAAVLAHQVGSTREPFLLMPLALVGIGLGALEAPTTSARLRGVSRLGPGSHRASRMSRCSSGPGSASP